MPSRSARPSRSRGDKIAVEKRRNVTLRPPDTSASQRTINSSGMISMELRIGGRMQTNLCKVYHVRMPSGSPTFRPRWILFGRRPPLAEGAGDVIYFLPGIRRGRETRKTAKELRATMWIFDMSPPPLQNDDYKHSRKESVIPAKLRKWIPPFANIVAIFPHVQYECNRFISDLSNERFGNPRWRPS